MSAFSKQNLVRALKVLAIAAVASAVRPNGSVGTASTHGEDLAAAQRLLPADHPTGTGATVTLVSLKRVSYLEEPTLSTFIVDYAPGGSAVLHRAPSSGYVLVYVLSGAIRASAWQAGVGIYRAGEIWAEPAFAYDIAATNASASEPARALVVLVTGRAASPDADSE